MVSYLSTLEAKEKDKAKGNFGVNLRLRATNDAEVNLDIDRTSGNTLKAKGTGDININVYNEQFDIKGSYGVDEGSFNYKLLGLTNKVFSINKGGSVNFTGDVMNTESWRQPRSADTSHADGSSCTLDIHLRRQSCAN